MSAVDALGTSLTTRAQFTMCMWPGMSPMDANAQVMEIRQVTDCASLHDTIHKDGAVSLPSGRRLLLDLVGYRELMQEEIKHMDVADDQVSQLPLSWVPTTEMLADELTKKSSGDGLRTIMGQARARLREECPDEKLIQADSSTAFWTVFWRKLV